MTTERQCVRDAFALVCFGMLAASCAGGDQVAEAGSSQGSTAIASSSSGAGGGPPRVAPPYDPSFALNRSIPHRVATDARSDAVVARLLENVALVPVAMSDKLDVPTVYTSAVTDVAYTLDVAGRPVTFRIAAGAEPGGGTARVVSFLDPAHPTLGPFTELRLGGAVIVAATKTVTADTAALLHYNSDGEALNPDGTPSLAVPFLGTASGSGLSELAGLVRADEVGGGEIEHALRFAYASCDFSADLRRPATTTDQVGGACAASAPVGARMDMGMRLELDPSVDCGTRTVPGKGDGSPETRFLRMVCRALQRYGMVALGGTPAEHGLVLTMEHVATANWSPIVGEERDEGYGWLIRDASSAADGISRTPTDGIPWKSLRVLAQSDF